MKSTNKHIDIKPHVRDKNDELALADLVTSFIRDGYIDPTGKTRKQIIIEMRRLAKDMSFSDIIIDHTEDILTQARVYRRREKEELACLCYAIWFEHTLNGFISSLAKRIHLSDKVIEGIIRDTSYKSKFSWLLILFGEKPFSDLQIKKISKLMEVRNAFVHYKWKPKNEQIEKEIQTILSGIEKTVRYVQNYENKYIIGMSRGKVKKILKGT